MRIRLALTLDIRRERPEPEPDRETTLDTLVETSGQGTYPLGFRPAEMEDRRGA